MSSGSFSVVLKLQTSVEEQKSEIQEKNNLTIKETLESIDSVLYDYFDVV